MIRERIINQKIVEKSRIKSEEIAKIDFRGNHIDNKYGIAIDIQTIAQISGGIEVLARAWRKGQPLGFGKNGDVEIERFRIYNPPIMVESPTGTYEIDYGKNNPQNGGIRKFKEDPAEAVRQVIAHNAKTCGKETNQIITGRIGNTSSTFYPAAGAVEPADGFTRIDLAAAGDTWATMRNSGTSNGVTSTSASCRLRGGTTSNQWRTLDKSTTLFDTSAIGSDTVDSGTYSLYGTGANNTSAYGGLAIAVDQCSGIASTSTGTAADANASNWDGVRQATADITFASWNTAGYNDFTLNATGIGNINTSGITKFGVRPDVDLDNSEPTWATTESDASFSQADVAGTAQDPKLVIVHSAAAGGGNTMMMMGLGT